MRRFDPPTVALALLMTAAAAPACANAKMNPPMLALAFSTSEPGTDLPSGWRFHALSRKPRTTRFSVVDAAGIGVLRAQADDAAGMIVHPLDLPATTTLIWRWKVDHALADANLSRKSGDDFAARVYVFFDVPDSALGFGERIKLKLARLVYGQDLPVAALCYVWANRAAVGTIAPSAYTRHIHTIVLESGNGHAGQWRAESRDLGADYRAAFHSPPPRISGIALASDTDNTHARVRAWFGDLAFAPAAATVRDPGAPQRSFPP
ncbi:MAG TPA: DUF3047 domain-containing protein [Rhodanobacteraceae bacterium]|nr:DUF3047 domain-containing protein [Rhodanobacteraceae bacterium]